MTKHNKTTRDEIELIGTVNGAEASAMAAAADAEEAQDNAADTGTPTRKVTLAAADACWKAYRKFTDLVDALNVLHSEFPDADLPDMVCEWADTVESAIKEANIDATRYVELAIHFANKARTL